MAPRKKPHPGQLDLFTDSDATVSVNDTLDALLLRDADRAEACLERLSRVEPAYRTLGAMRTLCRALREWPFPAAGPAETAAAARRLETGVLPAADAALGETAPDFMRPLWRGLADAAAGHPYHPDFPQAFSAGLYLRCRDYSAAAAAAESVPNRDGNPDAWYWLALARYGMEGLEGGRPALLRLALLAPERLGPTLAEIGDPALLRDWKAFHAACGWLEPDEAAAAWFPAWYLLEHPGTPALSGAAILPATPAVQVLGAMERLNALEDRGHSAELIAARSRLRELAPELFRSYMERHAAAPDHQPLRRGNGVRGGPNGRDDGNQ